MRKNQLSLLKRVFTHTHTHKRKSLINSVLILIFLGIIIFSPLSCKKTDFNNNKNESGTNVFNIKVNIDESLYTMSHQLESEPSELVRNAILEMTEILKNIKGEGYQELFALLHNQYFLEGNVGLKDLLNPETSPIYNKTEINPELKGKFKETFYQLFDPKRYPNLHAIIQRHHYSYRSSSQPDFLNSADVYFYMPYPEDDNGNAFSDNDKPTYVPAVTDADAGYGWKENNNNEWERVATNDDYAANNATIIVEPNTPQNLRPPVDDNTGIGPDHDIDPSYLDSLVQRQCQNLENGTLVRSVYLGHIQVRVQFDRYISFTGNGGGSEMRFGTV